MNRYVGYIISTLLLFTLIPTILLAQGEGSNWFFGTNAGVKFMNNINPVSVSGGQINTTEGCSSISDATGNLLFYTDGMRVWNKNHQIMPNGTGLLGDGSSTQSGVIVPKPNAPGRYYIFTTMSQFAYSEVDMSLDGGLGIVIPETKNTPLAPSSGTEKLTAVRHPIENAIWVITHEINSDAFYVYKVTASGVNPTPIISNTGVLVDWGGNIGAIKVSPNGKRIAMCLHSTNTAYLFDFNSLTGQVSNPISLGSFSSLPYGTEFSPDNSKVYIATEIGPEVIQFDLSSNNPNLIPQTKYLVANTQQLSSDIEVGSLQLGPDGKVYVSRYGKPFLGVISNPNGLGAACNYIHDGVPLLGGSCQLGLPNFIQSIFDPCLNTNLRFFSVFRKTYVCPDCNDGKIAATAIGGIGPYTYSINGGQFQSSGIFNDLIPGVYIITVRDANGCEVSRSVKLSIW